MTDTPRSLSAILALLADNSSSSISPQDLRDAIVSINDPVVDGVSGDPLFNRGLYLARSAITITLPAAASPSAIGTVVTIPLDSTAVVSAFSADPDGWANNTYSLSASDPDNTWGIEWAAHEALMLPRGVYKVFIYLTLFPGSIPVPTGSNADWPIGLFLDQLIYDHTEVGGDVSPTEPWLYDRYFNVLGYSVSAARQLDSGAIGSVGAKEMIINDKPDPQPFGLMAYTYGYEDDVDVTGFSVQIVKVA